MGIPQRFQRGWCKADAASLYMYCSVASLFRGFRPGAYRSRVLNAEMELKRRSGRSIAAKAVE